MTIVSVILPVFNRAHVVRRAIDSVLKQSRAALVEVIVVDDGSSDDLHKMIAPYGSRVYLVRHVRNSGAASARNTGLAAARGDFVAFLDSDDEWLPRKLARQIEVMRQNGWWASCTAFHLVRSRLAHVVVPRYADGPLGLGDLVWGCYVSPGSTLVAKREIFAEIGHFDTQLGRLEDWDWLLRYARKYPLGFLSEPLARVELSSHCDFGPVVSALSTLRAKHLAGLSQRDRRIFETALDFERAAALYRGGRRLAALPPLIKSWFRSPIGHTALLSVLRNRFVRG